MTGLFAEYQPQYAAHGIATFPVALTWNEAEGKYDKKPAVANYRKMGRPASAGLVRKYADADALGFCCGKHSKVTVIDYDSTDEALLREGNRRFGESPLMVRTNRGLHAYYRHNGERWGIKPFDGLDLDILGEGGGFTVAAPSKGIHRPYEFIRGGLDTLADLPVARTPDALLAPAEPPHAPADGQQHQVGDRISVGQRNRWVHRQLLRHAPHVDDFDALLDKAHTLNMECDPPMDDAQVVRIATSVWGYQAKGRIWLDRKARATTDRDEILALSHNPDATSLLLLLRVSHTNPGKIFSVTHIEVGELLGWTRQRVASAISTLLRAHKMERTYFGARGPNDPHLYRLRS